LRITSLRSFSGAAEGVSCLGLFSVSNPTSSPTLGHCKLPESVLQISPSSSCRHVSVRLTLSSLVLRVHICHIPVPSAITLDYLPMPLLRLCCLKMYLDLPVTISTCTHAATRSKRLCLVCLMSLCPIAARGRNVHFRNCTLSEKRIKACPIVSRGIYRAKAGF
jgi:hypothetical protein